MNIKAVHLWRLTSTCFLIFFLSLSMSEASDFRKGLLSRANDDKSDYLEQGTIYKDKNGYFQLSPPVGWRKEEFLKDPRSKVSFKHPTKDATLFIIAFEVERSDTIDSLLVSMAQAMNTLKHRMNGRIISVGEVSINGIPCVQAAFIVMGYKNKSMVFYHMNICYKISFTAKEEFYDELIDEVEGSIKTLHPLERVSDKSKTQEQIAQATKKRAHILASIGEYDEAIQLYEKSAALNPSNFFVYYQLGFLYSKTGQYNLSVASYAKALQHMPNSVITHCYLGAVLAKQGKYKESEEELRIALSIEIEPGEFDEFRSEFVSPSMEEQLKQQGRINELPAIYKEFIHSEIHANLGATLRKQGRIDEAIVEYKKVLQGRYIGPGKKARIYSNIGVAYQYQGKYQQSLIYLYRGLETIREHLKTIKGQQYTGLHDVEEEKGIEAVLLSNIASIYGKLGDANRALTYFNQALEIKRETRSEYDEAMVLLDMASVCDRFGQHPRALKCRRQALSLVRDIGDKRNEAEILFSIVFSELDNITTLHESPDKRQQALENLQRALDVAEEIGDRVSEARAFCYIGLIYSEIGMYEQALRHSKQALAIAQDIDIHDIAWLSLYIIGVAFESQGKYDEALKYYVRAIDVIETTRRAMKSDIYRISFLEHWIFAYDSMIELLLKRHVQDRGAGYDRRAFYYAEKRKARAFLDLLVEASANIREGIAPELLKRETRIHARRSDIQSRMQTANTTAEERERLQKELEKVKEDLLFLKQEIMEKNPKYAEIQYPRTVNVEEIQPLLDDGTILLEYYIAEKKSALWAITKTDIQVFDLPSRNVLKEQVEKYRASLTMPIWDDKTAEEHQKLGVLLYDELFKLAANAFLVADAFPNYNKVIIVPDGVLHYLPFETLIMTKSPPHVHNGTDTKTNHYLIKDYVIRYVPSASVIAAIKELRQDADRDTTKQEELLAFGDPIFDVSDRSAVPQIDIKRSFEERGFKFSRLAHTSEEVRKIAKTLGIRLPSRNIRLRGDACEKAVKEIDLRKYKKIHFATHSILSDDVEWINQPAVVLSLVGNEEGYDGFLQMDEIFNLKMDADMVVLSSCNTALGEEADGEGMIGLTRAFMYAGTPSVVVSLWKVADKSTAKLMEKFYRNLKNGMTKSDALRKAKLELMEMEEADEELSKKVGMPVTISYASPCYWAPFVLIGDEIY
jgi:CHAT domain-containing protein/Tfp pilus assembly protein PilF